MKKIVVTALAVVTLALTLCSCAKVECDMCGKKVSKNNAEVGELLGQEYAICNDCIDELGSLFG